MRQDIRVVILEDDPFARNWMVMIAVRDWRTRVVGEANNPTELLACLKTCGPVDLIIMDTDIPGGEDWLPYIREQIAKQKPFPKILCTGIRPNQNVLSQLDHPAFMGYILKGEICYSLAWAVSQVMNGFWVITDSIQALATENNIPLRKPCKVLNGKNVLSFLPQRQAEVAKLVISSVLRKEMADEFVVSEDWIYQVVSTVYSAIGIKDFINDKQALLEYFGDDDMILANFEKVRQDMNNGKKPRDIETLAFHIITMPEMAELK
jgi:DNA-binding NarL/FixJ family response regulator